MNFRDTEAWRQALRQVPGAESETDIEVQPLAGGTTNVTFRVQTGEGAFVVRLHEPYSMDLGVDRRREAALHAAAAGAGLASRILAADPAGRYLVTEFLEGALWRVSDLEDEPRLNMLTRTLRTLHAVPAPEVTPLDLQALLERHATKIAIEDAALGQDLRPQLARAREILTRRADATQAVCIVHGDLSVANLIGTDRPRLIDWEYATVGDPLADLACLVAYYPRVLRHGTTLLEGCGLSEVVTVPVLEDLAWVYKLASDLWYRRLELARRHPPPAH